MITGKDGGRTDSVPVAGAGEGPCIDCAPLGDLTGAGAIRRSAMSGSIHSHRWGDSALHVVSLSHNPRELDVTTRRDLTTGLERLRLGESVDRPLVLVGEGFAVTAAADLVHSYLASPSPVLPILSLVRRAGSAGNPADFNARDAVILLRALLPSEGGDPPFPVRVSDAGAFVIVLASDGEVGTLTDAMQSLRSA